MSAAFYLSELDTSQESLFIHQQKSNRTTHLSGPEHPYFEKRIEWQLLKSDDVEFYSKTQLEEISRELSRTVSVPADYFDSAGRSEQIKEMLDKNECFRFSYSPVVNDIILLREVFRFKSLKNIRRSTGLPTMVFLCTDSGWTIFYDDFKCKRISAAGFVTR